MSSLTRLQRKLKEFEQKGILQEFLEDYKNKSYQYVSIKYRLSQISTYEVKTYLKNTYGIEHKYKAEDKK